MKRDSRAPLIIAVVLLILPVLYVGCYCALMIPAGRVTVTKVWFYHLHYRINNDLPRNNNTPLKLSGVFVFLEVARG